MNTALPLLAVLLAASPSQTATSPLAGGSAVEFVDFAAARNRSWRDGEAVRGWNETPGFLSPNEIPNGVFTAFGIPFAVINEPRLGGRDLVMLSAEGFAGAPKRATVAVRQPSSARALALLHAVYFRPRVGNDSSRCGKKAGTRDVRNPRGANPAGVSSFLEGLF